MSVALFPLCGSPKQAIRDGNTGPYAKIILPFYSYGYWFASGQQYTFPLSEAPQQAGLTENGINMQNPFVKAAGVCLNP